MKRLLHATILALTITSYGLPALADATGNTCPEPPIAVYEVIGTEWGDWVITMDWIGFETPPELVVLVRTDKSLMWRERHKVARAICIDTRATWNPNCTFNILVMEAPWLTEASASCQPETAD